MTLDEYLTERGETLTAFADRIGANLPTVSRIVSGKIQIPGPDLLWRIYVATGGAVGLEDFYGFERRIFAERLELRAA